MPEKKEGKRDIRGFGGFCRGAGVGVKKRSDGQKLANRSGQIMGRILKRGKGGPARPAETDSDGRRIINGGGGAKRKKVNGGENS